MISLAWLHCRHPTLAACPSPLHLLQVLGKSDARDPSRVQHRLELRDTALPPWVLDRLASVLAVTQVCFEGVWVCMYTRPVVTVLGL